MAEGLGSAVESMGAISALRTGNVVVDMMIAMCVPVVFKLLFDFLAVIGKKFESGEMSLSFLWSGPLCERIIDHKTVLNVWGDTNTTDRDTRNNVLLKAIQLYLDTRNTQMKKARIMLTSITESERPAWWFDDDSNEKTPAEKLKKYRLLQKAPNYLWQPIGTFGGKPLPALGGTGFGSKDSKESPPLPAGERALVELRVEENSEDKGEKAERTVSTLTYRLRSRSFHAIDSFIHEAYQWYLGELKKLEDNSRYLYEMQIEGGGKSGDRDEGGRRTYKRYKLSDEKTFTSLFFDEKPMLLKILKDFTNKTGKYRMAGYPHKLGLLLHGPPGTGKTSLIKAMAQHTGRSIVNVPLARITTNQELMDIMFDQQYMVLGEEVPIKLGFKDVIFVMEDVDAASKVVHRRDGKTTAEVTRTDYVEMPPPKAPWNLLVESNNEECRELVKILMEKSTRLKEAALSSDMLCGKARMLWGPPELGLLISADGNSSGEAESKATLEKAKEAKEAVDFLNEGYESAGNFLKTHAQVLKMLVEAGGEVNAALEDELLGMSPTKKAPAAPALARVTSGSGGSAGTAVASAGEEDEGDGQMDPGLMMATMMSLMGPQGQGGSGKGDDGPGMGSLLGGGSSSGYASKKDTLNLSGLLNVLDGVVDTPERILIMTTNHPEQLDPALIRPGRIDKKILLGYMNPHNITSMIEHYFQEELEKHEGKLDKEQRERVHRAILGNEDMGFPALNLTPAQVEQLSAEHDEVAEMLSALEAKGQPFTQPLKREASKPAEPPKPNLFKTSSTPIPHRAGTIHFDH